MKILVTGGFGFIGRNLTERLVKEGHEVTVVASGSEPHVPGVKKILYMGLSGIDWIEVQDKDVVFHQMANNDTLCQDEQEMMRANVHGPMKLFRRAADWGCKKFVYASSTAVYGNSPAPYREDTEIAPLNEYAKSKATFDKFAKDFVEGKDISVIGLRYCNVYGPGEDRKGRRMSMVGQLMRTIMSLQDHPRLFKDGTQKRDWVYVKDVVEANILAMNHDHSGHSIYNIGSGVATSFNDVIETIRNVVQLTEIYSTIYVDCPFEERFQNYTECNIEKARNELGFVPSFDLESGIKDYVMSLSS
jgi:ADP-L-glycero-D-manno-heptose 6-epimerase